MRRDPNVSFARRLLAVAAALILGAGAARASTITIVNLDGPGEGFNDPTPVAPVGGNPGTTVGEQRLFVFHYAASIWGNLLPSTVEILVDSNFDPLTCNGSSAVLGSAGPTFIESDFPNADKTMTWYHVALANRLAGTDLEPGSSDIVARFNSDIGKPACFPLPWYYGVDGNEGPNAIELLPVVIHELGHGLGFSTSTIAGVEEVFPSIYDYFLFDNTQGMHWPDMTEAQRTASSQNCSNLVWDGPSVTAWSPGRLGPKPLLRINNSVAAGDYNIGLASFGPSLTESGVTGDLVLVNDGTGVPTNGCEPFINAAAVSGNIALIDRGGCTFITKATNAQAAGAIGVVVADSVPGCPALGLGGASPAITIPVVRVTQDDGIRLKSALLLGSVNATLRVDPALKAGADANDHVLVFTPAPYQTGSSVSHWDISATPDLLMEPALNPGLSSDVDLTLPAFGDIGWFKGVVAVGDDSRSRRRLEPGVPNPTSGATTITYALSRDEPVDLAVYDVRGRMVARLVQGPMLEGRHSARWDGADAHGRPLAAGIYYYRLKTPSLNEENRVVIVR